MYKTTVAPKGYITGMIVGNYINKYLKKYGFTTYGENYDTLFRFIRKEVPKKTNGATGKGIKYYYHEADVVELIKTMLEKMPEIFEKAGDTGER